MCGTRDRRATWRRLLGSRFCCLDLDRRVGARSTGAIVQEEHLNDWAIGVCLCGPAWCKSGRTGIMGMERMAGTGSGLPCLIVLSVHLPLLVFFLLSSSSCNLTNSYQDCICSVLTVFQKDRSLLHLPSLPFTCYDTPTHTNALTVLLSQSCYS